MENDWRPSISAKNLKRRAQLLADVRLFFAQKGVLEVETPILSPAAPTAPYLDSFESNYIPLGTNEKLAYYLQTSPEFAMKRLLAAETGSIYQIAKAFRNGERGRLHSPEFTMLEWYRPELAFTELMDEVAELVSSVGGFSKAIRLSYASVFEQYLEIDIFTCSDQQLKLIGLDKMSSLVPDIVLDRDGWLELLMSEVIEPKLVTFDRPVIVYDFPASQAQLAKIHIDEQGREVAARFEFYAGGLELANGYDELLDADELRRRFEQDNQQRLALGKPEVPFDKHLLSAMASGLPQCVGVALGLDRLLMAILGEENINQVLFKLD